MPSRRGRSGHHQWLSRHPITWSYYFLSVVTGTAITGKGVYDWTSRFDAALGLATVFATYLTPVFACVALGLAHSAGLKEARVLAGWSRDRERLALIATVMVHAMGALAVVVVTAVAASMLDGVRTASPAEVAVPVFRDASRLVLVSVAAIVLAVLVAVDRSAVWAGLASGGIIALHLALQFTPSLVGQLGLKLMWPPTAATAIAESGRNYSAAEGGVAVAAFFACSLLALNRLGGGGVTAPRRLFWTWMSDRTDGSWVPTAIVVVMLVVGGPLALRIATPSVPQEALPSVLLQRSQGDAPEQVAEEFINALQRGQLAEAQTKALSRDFVVALPRHLQIQGTSQSFRLEHLPGLGRAEVAAYLAAGTVTICLLNVRGAWKVRSVGEAEC